MGLGSVTPLRCAKAGNPETKVESRLRRDITWETAEEVPRPSLLARLNTRVKKIRRIVMIRLARLAVPNQTVTSQMRGPIIEVLVRQCV